METYGSLRAKLEASGTVLSPLDLLIATHALSLDLTLVTNDGAVFRCCLVLRSKTGATVPRIDTIPAHAPSKGTRSRRHGASMLQFADRSSFPPLRTCRSMRESATSLSRCYRRKTRAGAEERVLRSCRLFHQHVWKEGDDLRNVGEDHENAEHHEVERDHGSGQLAHAYAGDCAADE